jgi:hypothetical protein
LDPQELELGEAACDSVLLLDRFVVADNSVVERPHTHQRYDGVLLSPKGQHRAPNKRASHYGAARRPDARSAFGAGYLGRVIRAVPRPDVRPRERRRQCY